MLKHEPRYSQKQKIYKKSINDSSVFSPATVILPNCSSHGSKKFSAESTSKARRSYKTAVSEQLSAPASTNCSFSLKSVALGSIKTLSSTGNRDSSPDGDSLTEQVQNEDDQVRERYYNQNNKIKTKQSKKRSKSTLHKNLTTNHSLDGGVLKTKLSISSISHTDFSKTASNVCSVNTFCNEKVEKQKESKDRDRNRDRDRARTRPLPDRTQSQNLGLTSRLSSKVRLKRLDYNNPETTNTLTIHASQSYLGVSQDLNNHIYEEPPDLLPQHSKLGRKSATRKNSKSSFKKQLAKKTSSQNTTQMTYLSNKNSNATTVVGTDTGNETDHSGRDALNSYSGASIGLQKAAVERKRSRDLYQFNQQNGAGTGIQNMNLTLTSKTTKMRNTDSSRSRTHSPKKDSTLSLASSNNTNISCSSSNSGEISFNVNCEISNFCNKDSNACNAVKVSLTTSQKYFNQIGGGL